MYSNLWYFLLSFFTLGMIIGGIALILFFLGGWWLFNRTGSKSPFTNGEMRKGIDVSYSAVQKIYAFISNFDPILNPRFDIKKAVICKQTGRIFPKSVNSFGVICIPKYYIKHYAKGSWLEWSELTQEQQLDYKHRGTHLLKGYIMRKHNQPGLLYVNLEHRLLMGWQQVPGTDFELLIKNKVESF